MNVNFEIKSLSQKEISIFLNKIKHTFIPKLDDIINIDDYSKKINENATQFTIYDSDKLIGFLACYINDQKKETAYITMLGVLEEYRGNGIANKLLDEVIKDIKKRKFKEIKLEVHKDSVAAFNLYIKKEFLVINKKLSIYTMKHLIIMDKK